MFTGLAISVSIVLSPTSTDRGQVLAARVSWVARNSRAQSIDCRLLRVARSTLRDLWL